MRKNVRTAGIARSENQYVLCFPVLLVLNDTRMFGSLSIGKTTNEGRPGTEGALDEEVV